jgi:hypothetical protein
LLPIGLDFSLLFFRFWVSMCSVACVDAIRSDFL